MKASFRTAWLWLVVASCFATVAAARGADEPASKPGDDAKPAATAPASGEPDKSAPAKEATSVKNSPADKGVAADRKSEDEYYELYRSLADTIDQVERNYVKPVDRRELLEAAIKGVLTKLDPYSSYISPDEMTGFRTAVESQFGGIGIQVSIDEAGVKVTTPLVGSPAYRAGVLAGDRIIRIEGEPVRAATLDDVVRKLKGEIGSSVTFTVQHALTGKVESFTVQRELIHVDTVLGDTRNANDSWNFMLDPEKRIGYIRITAFSRDTSADLKKALEELQRQKMRGLILDLRFNPGGLLTSAVEVADLFISEGRIVSTKGRNTQERVWDATKEGTFDGFPIAVLVNRYSASASEIVAASLQDHNLGVVIGERTWGKGSVQNVIELEEGKTALKLTTATYTRPNGHNIHRFPDAKESDEWGVKPNDGYDVRLGDGEMAALLTDRSQRDVVRVKEKEKDEKLAAAPGDAKPDTKADSASAAKGDAQGVTKDPTGNDGATATTKPDVPAAPKAAGRDGRAKFVDRQLQKAVEYLTTELARVK